MKYLVAYDLETGGVNPAQDAITEFAMVVYHVDSETREAEFQSLIQPEEGWLYSDEALKVQKRTFDEIAAKGRPFKEVLRSAHALVANFYKYNKQCSAVTQNGLAFDEQFLRLACDRFDAPRPFNWQTRDIKDLFLWLREAGYHDCYQSKLSDICRTLGVDFVEADAHGALYDADRTAVCAIRMMRLLRQGPGGKA